MTILIDADGCPVMDLTLQIARQFGVPVIILCDASHQIEREGAQTLVFDKGADSVDFALVNRVKPGDVVVTQDYGLASMCLAKCARVLNQNGLEYTADNIDALMLRRYENKKLLRAGKHPKVSFRNGRYYVMDGQHTIEGCILLNGGEDRPILCKVYTGLTMEQEALLFAEQNGHSAPLSAGIKLRAKVVGGDAPSKAFVAATNRVGLSLNYDSMQLSDYRISCVGTALKLYDQLGEEIYCEALRHIVAAWEGRPDSFRAAVLRGVMYFVQLYHGQYSAERLVRALGGVHPMELYRISRDNPAKLPGWRRYVYPIYTTYNGKCRKDALPMKF